MSLGRRPLTVPTNARGPARQCGWPAVAILGCLTIALTGCGSRSGPSSQPLDVGTQAQQQGADQHLAENGDHERMMPHGSMAGQPGGDMLTNGARPASASAAVAAPQQMSQQAPAVEDPTQPSAVEPLLDAGGFDPSPQGAGEVDHNTASGDIAAPPGSHE